LGKVGFLPIHLIRLNTDLASIPRQNLINFGVHTKRINKTEPSDFCYNNPTTFQIRKGQVFD